MASPLVQDLLRRSSPAMITLLFQLYAVDVRDITEKGKLASEALAAGTASWNYADGLWIGAFDFGRAFINTVRTYKQRAEAFVGYCESRVSIQLYFLISHSYRYMACVPQPSSAKDNLLLCRQWKLDHVPRRSKQC